MDWKIKTLKGNTTCGAAKKDIFSSRVAEHVHLEMSITAP